MCVSVDLVSYNKVDDAIVRRVAEQQVGSRGDGGRVSACASRHAAHDAGMSMGEDQA